MDNNKTPEPGSKDYPINRPQDLNTPKFNSDGKKEATDDYPPVENMNDQLSEIDTDHINDTEQPRTDLGNERDSDEEEDERIIRR